MGLFNNSVTSVQTSTRGGNGLLGGQAVIGIEGGVARKAGEKVKSNEGVDDGDIGGRRYSC
jgi:hypothetical protein